MANPAGDDLLALAHTEPDRATATAAEAIASSVDPLELSYAHQTLGIVQRDGGDIDLALRHMRTARRLAEGIDDPDRLADVRATLGGTLAFLGRSVAALRELDGAVRTASASGPVRPKVLMRRAHVLAYLGRHSSALDDLQAAVTAFRRSGDELWEARTLNLRAYVELNRGELDKSEQDLELADALFTRQEQHLEQFIVRHNLALMKYFRGDVPATLAAMAKLSTQFTAWGDPHLELVLDHARVLLVAGLSDVAIEVIESTAAWTVTRPRQRADLLLMRASARLGQDDPELALADAQAARRLFARHQRDYWRIRADLVALQARMELGRGSRRAAVALADSLADDRTEDGVLAALLAGRELAAKDPARSSAYLSRAALGRRRGNPLSRSTAWLAHALDLEVQARPRVLRAVGHGLDALAEHRASLGSPELRALTAIHSADLSALAVRHALPRVLGRWCTGAIAAALRRSASPFPRRRTR